MTDTLNAQSYVDKAVQLTGLENFCGSSFRNGLDAFVDSLNHDIQLNEINKPLFEGMIMQTLINRLEIQQLIEGHPEILEETIESPVFITGLPRSSTTIVQTLMGLDPLSRCLKNFETTQRFCPPTCLVHWATDKRLGACHESMEGLFGAMPGLRGINGINFMANGTAECENLMFQEFIKIGVAAGSSLFSYGDWVANTDMESAYAFHKKMLQVLQWKMPCERWVLKAPLHLLGLGALLKTYPDARILFTHRDPYDAMVSGASMVAHWTSLTTGQADIGRICEWWPAFWSQGMKTALKTRDDHDDSLFFDLFHQEISQDPLTAVKSVYTHFGIPFFHGHEMRMKAWLRDNPRSGFGHHDTGQITSLMDKDHINERFKEYKQRFSV